MVKDLKVKLFDPTLVADVNQTLSSLYPFQRTSLKDSRDNTSGVSGVPNEVPVRTPRPTPIPTPTVLDQINIANFPPMNFGNYGYTTNIFTNLIGVNETLLQLVPATLINANPSLSRITVFVSTDGSLIFDKFVLVSTLPSSLIPVASVNITFNGGTSKLLNVGENTSDPITFQVDAHHDYWFMVWSNTTDNPSSRNFVANINLNNNGLTPSGMFAGMTFPPGGSNQDTTGSNPIYNTLFTPGSWIASWYAI